jgi:PAS domain S-box-containing protein
VRAVPISGRERFRLRLPFVTAEYDYNNDPDSTGAANERERDVSVGPFVFLYAALVGFFAFAAFYHLILWSSSRRDMLLAVFSAECALQAAMSGAIFAIATAATPEDARRAIGARVAIGMPMMVGWLWSVSLVSDVRPRWFVWPLTVIFSILFVVHLVAVPLNPAVIDIETTTLPWGETISVPLQATPGWWHGPIFGLVFSIDAFALWCASRLWKRDRVAGFLMLLAAGVILLILLVQFLKGYGKLLSVPYFGVLGHVLWVAVIALLIARRHRKTRDQLAASEQRLRGIFDQTLQFVGLMTTDGRMIAANRTSLEFAGVREADVIGKPAWETPWWVHSSELQNRLQQAVRGAAAGETVRFEATHRRPDGRLADIDFSLKPIRDAEGHVTLLISEGRDITDRRREEEQRRALESQLAQVQKVEMIGQLAGGVAHDFNNVLTVINGYSEMLQSMVPPNETTRTMLDGIVDAGRRAASLTRQLLTFTRLQVVESRALDLNEVVIETETMLRRIIGEDVCLATVLDPELSVVKADAGQIGQVIINLAVNARDAMPTGGKLTIRTANVEVDESVGALHPRARPGRYVMLAVTDTGLGMSPEIQARIFEPFFTTKGPGEGTGLGLATVRMVVEEAGGFLTLGSAPGRGTTFKLHFPVLAATPPSERPGPNGQATPRGNETIFLVEDEEAVRSVTSRILRRQGYRVVEASGGAAAIRLVEQHAGPIDLLITDVVMPEVNGRQLVEHLLPGRPDLRVLYVSGYTNDAVVRHGVFESNVDFLQKPFTIEALTGKVRQVLDAAVS